MQDGLCYIQYNANTLYAFPDLRCTEGSLLPQYSNTTRETYYIYNGKPVLSNRSTVSWSNGQYSSYIAHISQGYERYYIDVNYLILPATLVMLCFFAVIYRWFVRLRG